jgi:heptosyltransferase-2
MRVLVFLLSGIGDTLMFTPALRLLRRSWPDAAITVVTMRGSEFAALEHSADLDDLRLQPFLQQGLLAGLGSCWSLRRERFDVAILPCPSNRIQYNAIGWLAGARERVAFRYLEQSRQNLDFLNTELLVHRDGVHNAEHNLQLVEHLIGRSREAVPGWEPALRLPTVEADRVAADVFLRERGLANAPCIGLHVSSSRAKHMERKCWPKERFRSLIEAIGRKRPEIRFLLFCGDEDLPDSEWLAAQAGPKVVLARTLPLRTVAELIRSCEAFVSNDSGVFHIACAVQTPTVVLFGPTHPQRTGPWHAPAEVVRLGLPCSPCFYHTSHDLTCRAGLDFACLRDLEVTDVLAAVERALGRRPGAAKPVLESAATA